MKQYDFKKAATLIEENKDNLVSASLGMHEDWSWTANTVFEDGEFSVDFNDKQLVICGIDSSYWATPTLELVFKSGDEKMIPCFISDGNDVSDDEKQKQSSFWAGGVISGPTQANIKPLEHP